MFEDGESSSACGIQSEVFVWREISLARKAGDRRIDLRGDTALPKGNGSFSGRLPKIQKASLQLCV